MTISDVFISLFSSFIRDYVFSKGRRLALFFNVSEANKCTHMAGIAEQATVFQCPILIISRRTTRTHKGQGEGHKQQEVRPAAPENANISSKESQASSKHLRPNLRGYFYEQAGQSRNPLLRYSFLRSQQRRAWRECMAARGPRPTMWRLPRKFRIA